jgi:hypothetical protein
MALPDPFELVTLDNVKDQLRLDTTADDAWLSAVIRGVSLVVLRWCGGDIATITETDTDTDTVRVQPDVVHAVLIELAYQYANREGPSVAYMADWYARGYSLSAGAVALLQHYHKPVTA